MRDSLMPGLEGVDQYPGHLEAQISLQLIFSLWGYIKTKSNKSPSHCSCHTRTSDITSHFEQWHLSVRYT